MSRGRWMRRGLAALAVAALPAVSVTPAEAFDSFIVGPRAMGMGGTGVASVNDTTAQYYNPAAFGFFGCTTENGERIACDNNNLGRKDWGMDLNAALGYRINGEAGTFLDELSDIDPDQLSTGVNSESDLQNLIRLVKGLEGLDEPGNAITADVNAGLGIRFGHFAIGARGFFAASGLVEDLDEANLGFDIDGGQLASEIAAPGTTPTGYLADGAYTVFSSDQATLLVNAFVAQGASQAEAQEAVDRLDYVAAQEGLSSTDLEGSVALLEDVIAQSGGGSLEQNTTTVVLQGYAVGEVPLSYGYAINDHWSVGGNLKLMQGRVYGNKILVFDDDSDDVLAETDEKYEDTTTFGVDLGIMGRYKYVNFGIVGRNLNSPKFDGFTDEILLSNGNAVLLDVEDVTLDPQVTAGVAFIPFETLTFAVDYDLTENQTTLPEYDNRRLALGAEWDAFRFLALRAGAYKNVAEDDIGWVYTAGLGLNLWAVRLDVAGAFSTDKEEFDGDEIPQETRLAAQLSVDF